MVNKFLGDLKPVEDKLVDDAWELVWVHNGVKDDLQAWRNPPIDNHMLAEVDTKCVLQDTCGYVYPGCSYLG